MAANQRVFSRRPEELTLRAAKELLRIELLDLTERRITHISEFSNEHHGAVKHCGRQLEPDRFEP